MEASENSVDKYRELKVITSKDFEAFLTSADTRLSDRRIVGDVSSVGKDLSKKRIVNCCFEDNLSLSPLSATSFAFNSCVFQSEVNLSISEIKSNVHFTSCPQIEKLIFDSCSGGSISIKDCKIVRSLNFVNLDDLSRLNIENTQIGKDLVFYVLEGKDERTNIRITNTQVGGDFLLNGDEKFPLIYVFGGRYESITPLITNGRLHLSAGLKTELNIGQLKLDMICGLKSILVIDAVIDTITQNEIIGDKTEYRFQNSIIKNLWDMRNSAPSDLQLINVEFAPNCKIHLDNSMIGECVFSGVTWPASNLFYSSYEDKKKQNQSLREAYRQLKQAMLKDGNNIDALAFYRNEMNSYWEYAWCNPQVNREDKFILFISLIFSNHGQSFVLPLIWLLGAHLVLFLIAIEVGYNGFYFTSNLAEWGATADFVGSYFHLLNPVHKLPDTNGGMLIVDFFMRLSSGFFIYHIIRASRKFAKV